MVYSCLGLTYFMINIILVRSRHQTIKQTGSYCRMSPLFVQRASREQCGRLQAIYSAIYSTACIHRGTFANEHIEKKNNCDTNRISLQQIEPLENTTDKMCMPCERKILQAQKLAELIIRTDEILRQRLHTSPVIVCDKQRSSKPTVMPEEIFCEPFKQEPEDCHLMQPIETCLVAIKKEELSSDEETVDQDEVE
jgi:hypothetical protein